MILQLMKLLVPCLMAAFVLVADAANDGLTRHDISEPSDRAHLSILVFAFGTRGDIQPVLELCRIFETNGHHCIVAANADTEQLVTQNGFEFLSMISSEVSMLKQLTLYSEHGMSSMLANIHLPDMMDFIDDLAVASINAVKTDIKTPEQTSHRVDVVMAPNWVHFGSNIAEYLHVPFIEYQIFPTTKTREFSFFASENAYKPLQCWLPWMSGRLNKLSYNIASLGTSAASIKFMNKRRDDLALPRLDVFQWHKRLKSSPIIYAFSTNVVPKPIDWSSHVHVVGYWIPPSSGSVNWRPSAHLLRFISKEVDKRPIVYFDLGSMMIFDCPQQRAIKILNSIKSTTYRWIISVSTPDGDLYPYVKDLCEDELLKDSFFLKKEVIPHTWLIPKVDVYMHHGGAGSCAAAFYAGAPSIVLPTMGDQYQNCNNVERMKVGVCVKKEGDLEDVEELIESVLKNQLMKAKAIKLRNELQQEDVADQTMKAFNTELDYILSTGNQFPGQYEKKN